ncbi:glycoside hydrolase family 19 protein [Photobacterium kagoshimensis]|uniref:glycoside hydrolase family 19 protein n=1 Tax=Photobacterium kagoshimensis TaxID=2910242 RepID=UPI003D096967
MVKISKSVGSGGKNKAIDVAIIQALLKSHFSINKPQRPTQNFSSLNINGLSSELLIKAIKSFQETILKVKRPDGRVDPNGATFNILLKSQRHTPTSIIGTIFNTPLVNTGILRTITATKFKQFFKQYHGLTVSKGEDLNGFFGMLQKDSSIKDIRWAAYILATTYHETTFSFKPLRESGLGKGYKYAKEFLVIDTNGIRGLPGEKYTNIYYGRGYVQLTWDYNYKSIGKALGLEDKLYINPDLALNVDIAYKITSHGMRNGTFTGKKLADYINGGNSNYFSARKIINGSDAAKKVASYAESIEILLRLAACSSSPSN